MKKAKIILAAVGIFAVVGGALAFKARSLRIVYYTTTNTAPPTVCPVTVTAVRFTTDNPVLPFTTLYTSTNCATSITKITTFQE